MLARRLRIFQAIAGLVVVLGIMWVVPGRLQTSNAPGVPGEAGGGVPGAEMLGDLLDRFGAGDIRDTLEAQAEVPDVPASIRELMEGHAAVGSSSSRSSARASSSSRRRAGGNRVSSRLKKARSRTSRSRARTSRSRR